ncbi:uncharacterized protein LOC131618200 isoform X1 [Vicia villosa]|uniref:uncharacterized protein LOC131618200 isoform X1 n=2 Tax=Vicia villosa TaxID=3911 RepID=UPI00273BC654|nr:uncharacterized protein LOC131618200 isoform X1 [Vicia villosa]
MVFMSEILCIKEEKIEEEGWLKMSATMISDPMMITASAPETQSAASSNLVVAQNEVEFAICECCGLTEECTPAYIERIRERYQGKWVCGLCGEAVKDEIVRSERLVSTEEAMATHMNFCKKFNTSGPPPNPAVHLISAMRQILRRSLVRSTPNSPVNKSSREIHVSGLARSESCFSTLSGS